MAVSIDGRGWIYKDSFHILRTVRGIVSDINTLQSTALEENCNEHASSARALYELLSFVTEAENFSRRPKP